MPQEELKLSHRVLLSVARTQPFNRGLLRRLWLNYFQKRLPKEIVTSFRGVPFLFHLDNTTERKALFNYYNIEEVDFVVKVASGSTTPVFIDIGANSGFYAQVFSYRSAPGGKVIAIEPNPTMCERIDKNTNLIGDILKEKNHQVLIENCALGAEESVLHLELKGGPGGAHIVTQPTNSSIEVKVDKLLNILQKNDIKKIDLLKIDVEGYEDKVLMPFFQNAARSLYPTHIIIEHSLDQDWPQDLWGCLKRAGYREIQRTRGNSILSLSN